MQTWSSRAYPTSRYVFLTKDRPATSRAIHYISYASYNFHTLIILHRRKHPAERNLLTVWRAHATMTRFTEADIRTTSTFYFVFLGGIKVPNRCSCSARFSQTSSPRLWSVWRSDHFCDLINEWSLIFKLGGETSTMVLPLYLYRIPSLLNSWVPASRYRQEVTTGSHFSLTREIKIVPFSVPYVLEGTDWHHVSAGAHQRRLFITIRVGWKTARRSVLLLYILI